MQSFDILLIGHLSKDINIALGETEHCIGGAVVFSSIALKNIGVNLAAVTKAAPKDIKAVDVFSAFKVPVIVLPSANTTSIRNTYLSEDRERRTCEALGIADPFTDSDIPDDCEAALYYLGGLIQGEFPEIFIRAMARRGKVALDAQGVIRVPEAGQMVFKDWPAKQEMLPLIHFFKTDAAEAETLTGLTDREAAAKRLHEWGAQEVMVTHNSGVLVYAEDTVSFSPFTPRNLSGRTGRGDTCFASYCAWRKDHSPEESCRFAAALTSIKMEKPGPFSGTLADVEAAIRERY